MRPTHQAQQGPTYQQPAQPQGGYYLQGQSQPVYNFPQGSSYYLQQPGYTYTQQPNPYTAQTELRYNQGPCPSYQPPYTGYQQLYQSNYTAYTPYGQNPLRQNQWGQIYSQPGWSTGTAPYRGPSMPFNPQLHFFATLELSDIYKLTNDLILHNPYWPLVPTKVPGDCPKFEGKAGEDPQAHVMTYHLWCSTNSWVYDSICLHLFQHTITSAATKWYIELSRGIFQDFNTLAMAFLTHFQLPVRYESGMHLLTSLKQDKATQILDNIHEWRRRRRLIKFDIPNRLLTHWFTTSFVSKIDQDISMGACVTEE